MIAKAEAALIARMLGARGVDMEQFRKGLEVEEEHADITGGDSLTTGRIVLAHLNEHPRYYDYLEKAEERMRKGLAPNAPWVDRIVSTNWQALSKRFGERRMPVGKEYGCGASGCVYATRDEAVVFKLTQDEAEAELVANIIRHRLEPDGLVRYYDICAVPKNEKKPKAGHVFAILREAANSVGDLQTLLDDCVYGSGKGCNEVRQADRDLSDYYDRVQSIPFRSVEARPGMREYMLEHLRWGYEQAKKTKHSDPDWAIEDRMTFIVGRAVAAAEALAERPGFEPIGQALVSLAKRGVLLDDVHLGNVGRLARLDGAWAITDPGSGVYLDSRFDVVEIEVL